ncbi:ATP-binding protein [Telmatospirillum sp.]|uniref:ATP-binding protein n=1 Tax=Telmatospirillum sp. TaxID=2079197 RepID=UPI002842ABFF|nr:ATP-binding protein [Telmatospirillum sp.]MDR3435043.1 ATP-binding protein [Telmatospirillum sp.]
MTRFLPKSLFGQTVVIVLLGLAISQVVGAWIYSGDREETVRAISGQNAAQRVANVVRLLEESAPENRVHMTEMLGGPGFRITIANTDADTRSLSTGSPAELAIKDFLVDELSLSDAEDVQVALSGEVSFRHGQGDGAGRLRNGMGMGMGRGRMAHAMGAWQALAIAVHLSDGRWLSVSAGIPNQVPSRSWSFTISLVAMGLIVFAASAWAVRRVVVPLRLLGDAADRFGRDLDMGPLPETGPTELGRAARAFNRMQNSLRRLVENRSRLLAAVSHDLRTPLTLLRLRAEDVAEGENRDRMLATIADMEGLVGAALDFARQTGQSEARRPTDLTALLSSIVDDMADAGFSVSMAVAPSAVCSVQVLALKRALTNLIDNAVKYGGSARVALSAAARTIEIQIDDDGPGIPPGDLARVFDPFFRVEESRNADTGGVGLGLSIAQSIIQNHGGQIALANRPDGGLRVTVVLPV